MWKCYSVLYVFLILEVFSSTVGKVWKLMKPTEISFNLLHSLSSNLRSCNFFYNKHLYWKEKKIQTVWLHCLWSKQRLTTAALLIFIPVKSSSLCHWFSDHLPSTDVHLWVSVDLGSSGVCLYLWLRVLVWQRVERWSDEGDSVRGQWRRQKHYLKYW